MKEAWKMVKLGEVCRIERGGSPRPIKDYITDSQEGLNWIKIGDTDPQGKYIYRTNEKIKPEGLKKTKWVEENDLLLSNSMSYGRPYILKTNGCIHDGWLVIRDYQSSLNTDFFYYLLLSPIVQRQFLLKAQGSTVSNLNTQRVTDVNVLVPPLEEQHRIVSILDASFEKIDALKKNAEENLKNAKALFQQVLAQELKPKEGWVEKKLGEVCSKIGSGATPHGGKESYKEHGISLIRSLNVYDNEFIYDELAHIDDKQADELTNVIIEKNDVLFNITGASVTRCCIVPDKILPARVNQHVSILRPQNDILTNVFLCYLMISMKDNLLKLAFSKGATRQAITKKQLEDLIIAYPNDMNEQISIVDTINTLSEKCRRLEQVAQQTIRECDALKQSILRQAFSGEL